MNLRPETVEQVRAFLRGWEAQLVTHDSVSIAAIGDERFVSAPERLRARLAAEEPADLAALVAVLGDDVVRVVGEARLAYADEATFRPVATEGVIGIGDDDARLVALAAASDPAEWLEASADEPCEHRYGVIEKDSLLAIATLHEWGETLGHIGAFTAAQGRGRGLAARVGSAATESALGASLVPQWRSRIGNDASARVADKLGFVALGRQMAVRVNPD